MGDPIEVASIGKAIGAFRSSPLPITSVKAHVGHLEPASGMAGLVKAIACLKHRQVPRLPFTFEPNPAIDFEKANVFCAAQDVQLEEGKPLCCGVNSFGFGGAGGEYGKNAGDKNLGGGVSAAAGGVPSEPVSTTFSAVRQKSV